MKIKNNNKAQNIVPSEPVAAELASLLQPDHERYNIDQLLARAEQAFKVRQYALNEHQRDILKNYGRSLVEDAVRKIEDLNASE